MQFICVNNRTSQDGKTVKSLFNRINQVAKLMLGL